MSRRPWSWGIDGVYLVSFAGMAVLLVFGAGAIVGLW